MLADRADRFQRQVDELQAQAACRFWHLFYDGPQGWFGVSDSAGRIVKAPCPLMELRGFFSNLPNQS
jgi:hypothetical protein